MFFAWLSVFITNSQVCIVSGLFWNENIVQLQNKVQGCLFRINQYTCPGIRNKLPSVESVANTGFYQAVGRPVLLFLNLQVVEF